MDAALISVLALSLFGMIYYMRIRRWFHQWKKRRNPQEKPTPAFDLAELHAMLARGQLTQEEYDRLRAKMLNQSIAAQPPAKRAVGFDVLPPNPPAE